MNKTRYYWKHNRPLLGKIRKQGSLKHFVNELVSLVIHDIFNRSLSDDLQAWFDEEIFQLSQPI
jgi:hypothetical protein